MRTKPGRILLIGTGAVVAAVVVKRDTPPGRAVRRAVDQIRRRLRDADGRLEGLRYHLEGRHPDPDVSDDVLADRVRSSIGRIEHDLDIPHVNVTVQDHVVLLHGEVPDERSAWVLEFVIGRVSGVRGVESRLHIGLGAGDTRPSEGRRLAAAAPSHALRALTSAAHDAGAPAGREQDAVRAVLATLADRLPEGERKQLFAHVPRDVHELADVAGHGSRVSKLRTVPDLVAAVADRGHFDTGSSEAITEVVLATLRRLVPEEAHDVAAVLPDDLRAFWMGAVA